MFPAIRLLFASFARQEAGIFCFCSSNYYSKLWHFCSIISIMIFLRQKNTKRNNSGNAVVYVLIALALFGALSLTLSRQSEQADSSELDAQLVELYSTKTIQYANTAKNVIDQMLSYGTSITELDFVLPSQSSFDDSPYLHKLYHPSGGGLNYTRAESEIFSGTGADPAPGWHIGYNDVEWTPSTTEDVILTAHLIDESICAALNEKMSGSPDIPTVLGTGEPKDYLIDDSLHTSTNATFTSVVCSDCDGYPSYCVTNTAGDEWTFYNILVAR